MSKIKELVHEDFIKLKANREEYFDEFYNKNYDLVYRICYSILKDKENSEDITQNIFVKIYKMPIEKFPTEYESSWLYTVSKNEALQFIRSSKNSMLSDEGLENIKSNNNEIDDIIDNENYEKIIKKLNKKQEQIVSLKVVSDFTFKEIGEIMSMPTATVQWHYYSSIKHLKLALSNLAMFIVCFIVGMGVLRSNESERKTKKENIIGKETDDSELNEDSDSMSIESESTESKNSGNKDVDSVLESVDNYSATLDGTTNVDINESNLHIGIFCISGIFLVISIIFAIFFIKSKQKLNKKTSKNKRKDI